MATPIESVTIVGFGLIGASLAAALRARSPSTRLVAIDLPHIATEAAARAMLDQLCSSDDRDACRRALASSSLTVLAGPVRVIESQVAEALELGSVVTDCGSTKRDIVRAAAKHPRAARFVGGHPMAGRTTSGFAAATATLFEGQPWIVCPDGADADAIALVESLVLQVGARLTSMPAAQHDAAVALTSHVPKLLAAVLVKLAHERDALAAGGPAFSRATHVAAGDVGIWRDILGSNSDQIAETAAAVACQLDSIAQRLRGGDVDDVMTLLREASLLRSPSSPH